jgi:hypothetical protein
MTDTVLGFIETTRGQAAGTIPSTLSFRLIFHLPTSQSDIKNKNAIPFTNVVAQFFELSAQ